MTNSHTLHTVSGPSQFPTTRWTLVTAAIDSHQNEARSALVALCEAYWYPLYAYVRRRGYPADQAQDFTQEFFVRVLEGRYLERADPEKGRFRAFILTCMKFFLADEGDRVRALKRGGGAVLSLEMSSGEERYEREPAHEETPERIFERRWALSVLDRVIDRLRAEFMQHGRQEHFERQFATLRAKAAAKGVTPQFEVSVGHPAEQILYHADSLGAGHIVLGHRGKNAFQRWLMGSVSKRIISYATCSVTVVR